MLWDEMEGHMEGIIADVDLRTNNMPVNWSEIQIPGGFDKLLCSLSFFVFLSFSSSACVDSRKYHLSMVRMCFCCCWVFVVDDVAV